MTDPQTEDVFIVDNPSHSKEYRNKVAQMMFENCKVQTLNFLSSATLALFSTGRTEGLSIEIGHGITSVVPVFGVSWLAYLGVYSCSCHALYRSWRWGCLQASNADHIKGKIDSSSSWLIKGRVLIV